MKPNIKELGGEDTRYCSTPSLAMNRRERTTALNNFYIRNKGALERKIRDGEPPIAMSLLWEVDRGRFMFDYPFLSFFQPKSTKEESQSRLQGPLGNTTGQKTPT